LFSDAKRYAKGFGYGRGAVTRSGSKAGKTFRATLEKGGVAMGWTIARVPFEPRKVWPEMIRGRVRGELRSGTGDWFGFRNSLFPDPRGGYFLLVNRAMQGGAGAVAGGVAEFRLEPDLAPRPAELPDELAALLDEEPGLREWYDELSESTRREIGKWVMLAKGEESLLRRAGQMAERLLSAMEAERELPPLIERAMRARPKARDGWARMTVAQRRSELLGVFYYQTPEARERRVAKLVETAEKKA
jgi:uncharacterized protein YdeI (YjbR/CyaY-like superfamily)